MPEKIYTPIFDKELSIYHSAKERFSNLWHKHYELYLLECLRTPIEDYDSTPDLFFIEKMTPTNILMFPIDKGYILRTFPISIDLCSLFSVDGPGYEDEKIIGLTQEELQTIYQKNQHFILDFSLFRWYPKLKTVKYYTLDNFKIPLDDIGPDCIEFRDIQQLKEMEIPSSFTSVPYTIDREDCCAPLSAKEGYCVLYAMKDSVHSGKSIKVLRWFPTTDKSIVDEEESPFNYIPGSVFFELGYLEPKGSEKLYHFMIENDNQLLFAKKTNDQVKILGGVSFFYNSDFRFPNCLLNIPIL